MDDPLEQERKPEAQPEKTQKSGWLWPAGAVATGVAGVALLLLRGCWHRRMSWPVRAEGHSYQVCLGCGVKRLFDEQGFRPYGPFHYDLNELIAWETARRQRQAQPIIVQPNVVQPIISPREADPIEPEERRPAS